MVPTVVPAGIPVVHHGVPLIAVGHQAQPLASHPDWSIPMNPQSSRPASGGQVNAPPSGLPGLVVGGVPVGSSASSANQKHHGSP